MRHCQITGSQAVVAVTFETEVTEAMEVVGMGETKITDN
jgi:hypothetical protein